MEEKQIHSEGENNEERRKQKTTKVDKMRELLNIANAALDKAKKLGDISSQLASMTNVSGE